MLPETARPRPPSVAEGLVADVRILALSSLISHTGSTPSSLRPGGAPGHRPTSADPTTRERAGQPVSGTVTRACGGALRRPPVPAGRGGNSRAAAPRSEEHTSDLPSLMRNT